MKTLVLIKRVDIIIICFVYCWQYIESYEALHTYWYQISDVFNYFTRALTGCFLDKKFVYGCERYSGFDPFQNEQFSQ